MTLAYDCSVSGHKYHFTSNAHLSVKDRRTQIDCEMPEKISCTRCDHSFIKKCGRLKDYLCVPCSLRAKADKKLVLRSGLMKSSMGWVELTLTAPGTGELDWASDKCNHASSMKCSGKIGCKVDEIDGAIYNGQMPKSWNRYMQAVRRLFTAEVQYGKVFEAQTRDVLHIHALLIGVPAWPLKRINKELRRLAKVHGFGGQISVKRVVGDSPNDRQKAVGYVAKYLTKGSKTLKSLNLNTGEIRSGGYRDFTQSRHFGDTLKQVRAKRLLFVQSAQSVGQAREAETRFSADATATGDEVALDNYKKSYTFIE